MLTSITNKFRVEGGRSGRAFSVIELMLSVSIMGVIIFALYSVFNQTQRAMRNSQVQTDVAERARAVLEMISRELEQAQPTFVGVNGLQEINMLGGIEYEPQVVTTGVGAQARQDVSPRTNFLHNIFFLVKRTNAWMGVGYRVVNVTNSVGTLQRFETTNVLGHRPYSNYLSASFLVDPTRLPNSTNYHHVSDGVIHLSLIPYDRFGRRLGWDTTNRMPEYTILRQDDSGAAIPQSSDTTVTNRANVQLRAYPGVRAEVLEHGSTFAFKSNAMPASIDLQLAILEPEVLSQYYRMLEEENPNASTFLSRQVARVHLFRQRIPIRTAAQ